MLKTAVFWDITPYFFATQFRSPILVTTMMEAVCSSESLVLTRATRRNIPEHGIVYSHRRENLKSYIALTGWAL
jgi:hypothetical protein